MMPDPPEEFSEFLFGPKERPDGTQPKDEDERRRLDKLSWDIQRAAYAAGIEIVEKGSHPPEPVGDSGRSRDIAQQANALMPQEDECVRTTIERAKIKSQDGSEVELLRVRLGVLDDLGKTVMALAKAPAQAVEVTKAIVGAGIRLGVHVGRLFKAEANVGGDDDPEKLAEQDDA